MPRCRRRRPARHRSLFDQASVPSAAACFPTNGCGIVQGVRIPRGRRTGGVEMAEATDTRAWHEIVRDVLKRHNVNLVTYVPDNVLRPLIEAVHADPFFTAFACT